MQFNKHLCKILYRRTTIFVTKALFRRWQSYLVSRVLLKVFLRVLSPKFVFPGKNARGTKQFEVNVRSVFAFRGIGKGNELMHTFTTMMNMPALSHQS